ncbi:hypothetical protein MKX03_003045, partial [Papaver bracteatum]
VDSSSPQMKTTGVRTTVFGINTNISSNGGVIISGIPPIADVRGRGGRAGARGTVSGRGGGAIGAVRGRGGRTGAVGGRGTSSTVDVGTQSSQTSAITQQTPRGRRTGIGRSGNDRMRSGNSGLPCYPVENMTRRNASLMEMTQGQPPTKRGKQSKKSIHRPRFF